MSVENYVWYLKHRPKRIADCVLPSSTKKMLQGFVDSGDTLSLLFAGPPGIGKTTCAIAMCEELGVDWLKLNGSGEDRGIDAVKHKIVNYATAMSIDGDRKKRRMIIFDEADNLTADAQMALRATVEEVAINCGFILTANNEGRLTEPIRSRFQIVRFSIPPTEKTPMMKEFFKSCCRILTSQGVKFDKKVVQEIVKAKFPDMRSVVNLLQANSVNGELEQSVLASVTDDQFEALHRMLREGSWKEMRDWVGTEASHDPMGIALTLWQRGYEIFDPKSYPVAVLEIDQFQVEYERAADKTLHLAALLTKLMTGCKFK